jgi:ATP-dependent RNA circularization protein (DNA/RNA ligase family)
MTVVVGRGFVFIRRFPQIFADFVWINRAQNKQRAELGRLLFYPLITRITRISADYFGLFRAQNKRSANSKRCFCFNPRLRRLTQIFGIFLR